MSTTFFILTLLFIIISASMVLIILVQRAQGGGLAGAFGGAGAGGTDSVFGGRIGDALTWATVIAFGLYLTIAVVLNRVEPLPAAEPVADESTIQVAPGEETGTESTPATDGAPPASDPTAATPIPVVPAPAAPDGGTAPADDE